jgi:hypothetical protein
MWMRMWMDLGGFLVDSPCIVIFEEFEIVVGFKHFEGFLGAFPISVIGDEEAAFLEFALPEFDFFGSNFFGVVGILMDDV